MGIDYKNQDKWKLNQGKGEIVFSNYVLEFATFYKQHKELCDSISGINYNVIGEEQVYITRNNFHIGINKLRAFITTYDYSISEKSQREEINLKLRSLENKYYNDIDYKNYIDKDNNLSLMQDIDFNNKYINYLFEVFEISYLISKYLQKSLNLSSKEIMKNINYVNYDNFFHELNHYRNEITRSIANIKYEEIYDSYKKILGYFYTYRYLMRYDTGLLLKNKLRELYDEISNTDTNKKIISLKTNNLNKTKKSEIMEEFMIYKEYVSEIYRLCNFELQGKNILPKQVQQIEEDNTLI